MESQESLIVFLVYGIMFTVFLTTGLMLFFFYSRKRIVAEQLSKIELQLNNQKDVLKAIISTQEDERQRIAQDMHDAISSKLNLISLTTNLLIDDERHTEDQLESLNHILNITTNILESARRIAHDLLPPVLGKFGLQVALEELVEDFLKTNKVQIHHTIQDLPDISLDDSLHIFRIVQELFNNAIRHGGASQVIIEMKNLNPGFDLIFRDNGIGFNTEITEKISGIGLQNIESRAAILKATLNIYSKIGEGSTFEIKSIKDEQ